MGMNWPAYELDLPNSEVQKLYESGFDGATYMRSEHDRFQEAILGAGGNIDGEAIAYDSGFAATGQSLLSIMTPIIERIYPGSLPGPGQDRGDCVAHGTKNACLATLCCEIAAGLPDEVTGRPEGAPVISEEGMRNGSLSTEAIYWHRGYNGDGWQCHAAARVAVEDSGLWIRKDYPELGFDLTSYSGRLAGKYGKTSPPDNVLEAGREHLIRTATEIDSFEVLRDFIHNGYGVSSCGGEGFSSKRDENGVSERSGRWSHAMAYLGVDDREIVRSVYDGPLILVQNSWGKFNGGPRIVKGTKIAIPEGSFWARWSDVKGRYMIALSSVDGWPPQKLPDYGSASFL